MIINKMPRKSHIPRLVIPAPVVCSDTDNTSSACCRTLTYEDTKEGGPGGGPLSPTSLTADEERGSPSPEDDPSASPVTTRSPRPGSSCYALRAAVANLTFWDDFEANKIGSGFFSDVYKIRHHGNGDIMVVKISKSRNNRQNQQKMLQELELLNKLNHPNVVRYMGACVKDGHIHPLLEFISGGPLEDVLKDETLPLSWQQKTNLATDIARGMEYLHSKNVCHRDLKSENCLVRKLADGQLEAVVADFGLARVVTLDDNDKIKGPNGSPRRMSLVGSPYWMAPEILRGEEYTKTVDVFSFGIILCEIMARIPADPDDLPRTNLFGLDVDGFRNMCPDCPADLLQIADDCCSMDPTKRPSFTEIYHHLCHISHKMSSASSQTEQSLPRITDESHLDITTEDINGCGQPEDVSSLLSAEITTHPENEEEMRTMQTSGNSTTTTTHESISDDHELAPITTDQSKHATRVRRALYTLSALSVLVTLCMLNVWRSIYTLVSVLVPVTGVTLYRVTIKKWWLNHRMTSKVTGFLHTLGRRLSWGKLPASEEKTRRIGRSGINMLELKSRKSNNNERQMMDNSVESSVESQDDDLAVNELKFKMKSKQDSDVSGCNVPINVSRDMSSFGEVNSDEESPPVKRRPAKKDVLSRRRLSRTLIRPGSLIHDSIEESADESPG